MYSHCWGRKYLGLYHSEMTIDDEWNHQFPILSSFRFLCKITFCFLAKTTAGQDVHGAGLMQHISSIEQRPVFLTAWYNPVHRHKAVHNCLLWTVRTLQKRRMKWNCIKTWPEFRIPLKVNDIGKVCQCMQMNVGSSCKTLSLLWILHHTLARALSLSVPLLCGELSDSVIISECCVLFPVEKYRGMIGNAEGISNCRPMRLAGALCIYLSFLGFVFSSYS